MVKAYGCVDCSISTPVMWCVGCSCPVPYKFRLPFPLDRGQDSGNWGCCLECRKASEGCWCDKCVCKQCGFYQNVIASRTEVIATSNMINVYYAETRNGVQMNISDYYMRAYLYAPPMLENREFAIIKQGKDAPMWRHLGFKNVDKLRAFLIENAPAHVYFSCAKYEYPELEPMRLKKKYWLGSDLIFDIDFPKLKIKTLQEAQKQSLKLIKILQKDFGFEKLLYVFSGNRGYHVHVYDACIQKCDNAARREIADYFCELLPWKEKELNDKYVGIDEPVTCDVSRLIRLPGSLHGGSGKVCEIILIEMPQFNRRANIFFKDRM